MAHLHHFHPSVCGLNLGSLCTGSPGPRFHYSELHKQITGALLKCPSRLLIDNEHRLGCLLCSTHHVPLAHGSASYAPLPPWPSHLPLALCSLMNTHVPQKTRGNPSRVLRVQGQHPYHKLKLFWLFSQKPQHAQTREGIHCKNPSAGWLCHGKLVIQVAPPKAQSDTGGYLIWADLLSRSYLKRQADNDWLWRRDAQRSLEEGEVDCNGGRQWE